MSAEPCAWCHEVGHYIENGICDGCYWWYAWPRSFTVACVVACQNGDDELKRQRLYNELKAIGEI